MCWLTISSGNVGAGDGAEVRRARRQVDDDLGPSGNRGARGELDVLVGTQMIAKGLDFPNVRLVGVINADTALHIPDFRAGERTFGLIAQVAGSGPPNGWSARVISLTRLWCSPGSAGWGMNH